MKKRHFYLVIAVFLGVMAGAYTGWLIYKKSLGELAKVFVSADEDPSSTLRLKTDTTKAPVIVSGKVVDNKNNPQSGIIKIAGQEIIVAGGEFSKEIIPGVYKVSFIKGGVSSKISPVTVQVISSGQYNFVVEE